MSKWTKTPFETLEGAHATAIKFRLNPSSIVNTGDGLRSFETKEGRQRSILAQKIEGGPVLEKRLPKGKKSGLPLQDPNAPSFGEEDRLLTGPWTNSDYVTLSEVRAHYQQLGPSTRHKITFVGELLVIYYPDGDVVEYRQKVGYGVQSRSLMRAGNRTWRYEEPVVLGAEVKFNVGQWTPCGYASSSLEGVADHWKQQYVNFDNVEILEVTLYRIGQDEYEYVKDKNTGEVWCRKLSVVKEDK